MALSEGNDLQVDILSEHTVPASLHAPLEASRPAGPAPVAAVAADIPSDLQSHLDRQERDILVQTLRETGFNRTAAAARLGLSLRQIRYRIARLHIDVPAGPEASEDSE